jgi:large subunit ribosomal protein L31e
MADKTNELERIYTIPLRKAKELTRGKRADNAVRDVKRYLVRHMKADNVWLDHSVNEHLWSKGKYNIPSRIRVRATKFSDGVVEVTLPESTATGSIRDSIQSRREKAASAPVLKAPEAEEGEAGAPGSRPVTDVKGVGPATAEKLEKAGITTLQELADADPAKVGEAAGVSDDKAKAYVHDAKDILAGKLETADVKAQPGLAAQREAEKPKAGADERAHAEGKDEAKPAKSAKKDE